MGEVFLLTRKQLNRIKHHFPAPHGKQRVDDRGCTAPDFLDTGLSVFTPPPLRQAGCGAPGLECGSHAARPATVRCT